MATTDDDTEKVPKTGTTKVPNEHAGRIAPPCFLADFEIKLKSRFIIFNCNRPSVLEAQLPGENDLLSVLKSGESSHDHLCI